MFYWSDVRYALRLLARNPLFTLLTVVVLAGGLGLSIFTFSFLHTAMLKPLPLDAGAEIVRIMEVRNGSGSALDAADLAAIRPGIRTLRDIGAYGSQAVVIGTGEGTRSIGAATTEWNIFEMTHTPPALGRGFLPEDQRPGAEPVVVLSDWAFRVVFGGDRAVLDQPVQLNGVPTRVIGVMPAGYGFPVAAEAWIPIRPALLTTTTPGQELVNLYARLAPGVSPAAAEAELNGLLRRTLESRPVSDPAAVQPTGIVVRTFPMAQMGEEGPLVLLILNTLAALILLLACINVTNLLLARANERSRETAVRLALGAPRHRLIMQSMWESVILCLLGGALATVLALWGLRAINALAHAHLEGNLAFWWVWGFDRTALLAAGGFVTLAIAVLGGVVSRRAVNTSINAVLQEGGSGRGGDRREGRVARALVVTQVATVSVLLFFGSMSAIIAGRITRLDFGYDTRDLLSTRVDLPAERYSDAAARGRLFQQLQEQLAARSEVAGVVLRTTLAERASADGEFELPDQAATPVRPRTNVLALLGPLRVMGIEVAEGRLFDSRDDERGPPAVIVSRALAAQAWPGQSALGRQLRLSGLGATEPARIVVGVVDDILLGNPISRERSPLAAYIPLRQSGATGTAIIFRHRAGRVDAQVAVQQVLAALDPVLAPDAIMSYEEVLAKSSMMARFVTELFAACFGFALLLAVSGTYGLMARAIGRRTREIGVRRALGATDRTILLMLLGQGSRQLGVGALVALPFTLLVGWGFSHFFPVALVVSVGVALLVSLTVALVVLGATWLPTRRAVAVEPRDALWRE